MDYYDAILAGLPLAAGGIAVEPLAPYAGALSIALLAHALFVNPPRDPVLAPQH